MVYLDQAEAKLATLAGYPPLLAALDIYVTRNKLKSRVAVALRPLLLAAAIAAGACSEGSNDDTIAVGAAVYAKHCADCHGANLEGQANWNKKLPNGRWPAPPHDDSGHTWHHNDRWLFQVIERGKVPPLVRPGYESDMPAFGDKLSDAEIRAVISFIKSRWSDETMLKREEMISERRARSRQPWRPLEKIFDKR